MSRMADLLIDIEELYLEGYSATDISEMSGIQLDVVMDAIRTYGATWVPEEDDGMDGDWDSAMASAGFGTDEDYGFFGDEG